MIDPAVIGRVLPSAEITIERGRLRSFARAIGREDGLYTDVDVARLAGHPDLPVPLTFLFGLEFEAQDPFGWLADIGVDLRKILHGEQRFDYHSIAHAGDVLIVSPRIDDVYAKRDGLLEFVVKSTTITRSDGSPVADLEAVLVVRNDREAR